MKKILGISLGTSCRDHKSVIEVGGQKISIERIGTNGDFKKARQLLEEYDEKVEAFGIGGIDITLGFYRNRYIVKDALKLIKGIKTPIFDGNGIKHILDRHSLEYFTRKYKVDWKRKEVFQVCASNRYGMAQFFEDHKCKMTYGDLIFGLKLPIPIHSFSFGQFISKLVLPIATKLPHSFLYPIGNNQKTRNPRFIKYFSQANVIAGDYHYIYKYSPDNLSGKTIITTTTTKKDIQIMKDRGVACIMTTTPEIGGRAFGSNILEAVLFSYSGRVLGEKEYGDLLTRLKLKPHIVTF